MATKKAKPAKTVKTAKKSRASFLGNLTKKKNFVVGSVIGVFALLVVLVIFFGTPSSKSVFSDMQETMLKTKSIALHQTYAMIGAESGSLNFKSYTDMDLSNNDELRAKGTFTLNLTNDGVPMSIAANFTAVDSNKYVKFTELSSTDSNAATGLNAVQAKLEGEWIKIRENDNFKPFVDIPISTLTSVTPVPYANLNDSQRKVVLDILRDKSTYTIGESSKVETQGVSAYKYSISYNKDKYKEFEKAIAGYVKYIETDDESNSEIKSFNVWVDIRTKRVIKVQFTGTSDRGNTEGTILFTNYDKPVTVTKPSNYSLESELLGN